MRDATRFGERRFGVALVRLIVLLALIISFGCTKKNSGATASASGSEASEILIGEVGSLTGNEASFGVSTKEGVDLAIEEINKAGGIKGKKVRVLVLDDQGKPEEAATAVTRLITQDNVVAILGEVASSRSLAMAPIAQANKVPMISPASTNPKVTEVGNYIFRVCFIDSFQGSVMANFAFNSLKAKKAAILRDVKNDYSVGLSNIFAEEFKKMGGKIVVDQSYSAGDVDFKSQLTSIRAENPDVLFVPGYYTEVGLISRQAKEIGLAAKMLGTDGWDSTKLLEIGGSALNGNFFSNHYSPDDKNPKIQSFISQYKKLHGMVPDSMAVLGYDAMMVLADAIKRAKTFSPTDIRDALAATKEYPGVTGSITINDRRDAIKPAVVIEIKNGHYAFRESVSAGG
ncbi:MAG: ABC transporter substrate-binding protein [Bacteriovoracia bacterium]